MSEINELYGIDHGSNGPRVNRQNTDPFLKSGRQHNQGRIETNTHFTPTGWQKELTQLMKHREAVFTLAAPAAGKTNPMLDAMYALMQDSSNINPKDPRFPRVLYVAPRTQLSNQVAINDFALNNANGMVRYASSMMPQLDTNKLTPRDQRNLLELAYRELIAVVAGSSGAMSTIESPKFKVKPVIAATYTFAAKILKKYSNYINIVIIDELQEYLPKPGKPTTIADNMAQALMSILAESLPSKKGVVLATGSVNVNSAKKFVDFLETKFHRKIKFNVNITDANRSKLTVIPFTKMRNSLELADLTKDLISANKTNNVIITFNKKEKPVSRISILTTAQLLQTKLPVKNKSFLFSKDRQTETMKDFTDKEVSAVFREKPGHEKNLRGSSFRDINDIGELLYYNTAAMMSSRDGEAVHVTKSDPTNLLYQSVLRGFGFILGGMEDRQKAIIQKLFMDKKLLVLFATDAIGVGANVLSHNLFLPDLHKFEDGTFGQVNTSSLVQLINRAGRKGVGSIPYANVYVQEKDLELAQSVLTSDPRLAAGEIDIDFTSNELADKLTASQKFKILFSRIAHRRP